MRTVFAFSGSKTTFFCFGRYSLYLVLIVLIGGCTSIGYYRDAINGHFEILNKAEPIDEIIASDTTTPELRNSLLNIREAREFAIQELLLPDNGSYRHYADIGRECVAWNVIATGEFSIEPEEWCFPIAGCLSYKGFFNRQDARRCAAGLSEQGLDTCIAGAVAYSTLGWFDDPVLSTMLSHGEAETISTLFHELAHQKLFIDNDTAFNEAFANSVAEEGVRRWFARTSNGKAYQEFLLTRQHSWEFNDLILSAREELRSLYQRKISPERMRSQKQGIFHQLQIDYSALKKRWGGDNKYDNWMAKNLNNAHLSLVATYHDLVPIFRLLLFQANGDLNSFYDRVVSISAQPYEKRHQVLQNIYAQRKNWTIPPVSLLP